MLDFSLPTSSKIIKYRVHVIREAKKKSGSNESTQLHNETSSAHMHHNNTQVFIMTQYRYKNNTRSDVY